MKVFKMVIQLKLATSKREEINSIVTHYYLSSKQEKDSDAIELLEQALKNEQQKQAAEKNQDK